MQVTMDFKTNHCVPEYGLSAWRVITVRDSCW